MNKRSAVTIKESGDIKIIKAYGVEVEISPNRDVVVHNGHCVGLQPPIAANDTSVAVLTVGQQTADGVYIGQYAPKDHDGNSLGKIFNVFAAPEDLGGTEQYVDTVKHIARLTNWNGFDGTNYAADKEIYKALKDGSYNGGWIIPTRDLLSGKDVEDNKTQSGNLLAAYNKAVLQGVKTSPGDVSGYPAWYWSSTEYRDCPSYVNFVCLSDGREGWNYKDDARLSCRPVRLVPCKAP